MYHEVWRLQKLYQSSRSDLDQPEHIVLESLVAFQGWGKARQLSRRHVFSYCDDCVYGFYDSFYGDFYGRVYGFFCDLQLSGYQIDHLHQRMPYQGLQYAPNHGGLPVMNQRLWYL